MAATVSHNRLTIDLILNSDENRLQFVLIYAREPMLMSDLCSQVAATAVTSETNLISGIYFCFLQLFTIYK